MVNMRYLPSRRLLRIGNATVAWGLLFAVVHAYWAAGGKIGTNGGAADTPAAQGYIAVIAVLGLVGAAVAYRLVHNSIPRSGRVPLILLARTGGIALLLGVAVGTGRWLADWSLHGNVVPSIAITLYFLLGGVLFSTLGWRSQTANATAP